MLALVVRFFDSSEIYLKRVIIGRRDTKTGEGRGRRKGYNTHTFRIALLHCWMCERLLRPISVTWVVYLVLYNNLDKMNGCARRPKAFASEDVDVAQTT